MLGRTGFDPLLKGNEHDLRASTFLAGENRYTLFRITRYFLLRMRPARFVF